MSLLDKIATLEEKLPRLVEALDTSRRELREAQADRERLREQLAGKEKELARKGEVDPARSAKMEKEKASLEDALSKAEADSAHLQDQLETERAARSQAEANLEEALERLDKLVERLEGVETDLAALEEQTHGGS